jgi:hypothetical protein
MERNLEVGADVEEVTLPEGEHTTAVDAQAEAVRRFFDSGNSSMMGGWT